MCIRDLRDRKVYKMEELKRCIREASRFLDKVAGVLDPEGGALSEGPGLYAELLPGLGRGLVDCLTSADP